MCGAGSAPDKHCGDTRAHSMDTSIQGRPAAMPRPRPPVIRLKLWLAWAEVVEYFGGTNLAALAIVGCPRLIYQGTYTSLSQWL